MGGERRKDYMVSKRVHRLYLLTWVSSLVLVASLMWMVWTVHNVGRAMPPGTGTKLMLIGVLAFVIVCCSLFLAVNTIVHTHRLLGSAYRIGLVLKEVNSGQNSRIHLRDGDFFTEIAGEINTICDKAMGGKEGDAVAANPPAEGDAPES